MLIKYSINNMCAYPLNIIYNIGTKTLNIIMHYLKDSKY